MQKGVEWEQSRGKNIGGGKPEQQGSKRPGVKGCIPTEGQLETDNTEKAFTGPLKTSLLQGQQLQSFVDAW